MTWLERHWYRLTPIHLILWPCSLLFRGLVGLRRFFYRQQWLTSYRLPVPVIIVGNFVVGGSGKTPLVIWLAQFLQAQGYHPGILSRGYGAKIEEPIAVQLNSDPAAVGDEPLLIARRTRCPVWVHSDRVAAGRALLNAEPKCDVLICDDGLQHYRLQRDIELAVVDVSRGYGNGLMLPAGPLREPKSRAASVDILVQHYPEHPQNQQYWMTLGGNKVVNLVDSNLTVSITSFIGKNIHAIAGIGNPQRFFDYLTRLGLVINPHPYPDHYFFRSEDLNFPNADVILMTEKDAVKCAKYVNKKCWALMVDAEVSPELPQTIMEKLNGR